MTTPRHAREGPSQRLRQVDGGVDEVNRGLGGRAVGIGLGGMKAPPAREMRRAVPSKRCTSHWNELPVT
ncbi:MAG: DUF4113 domain-containing protein [Pseudoclavibacter sp.]|nr:DUF4113 domain-containing protein [Pseudoclavibacter sp.]